MNFVKKFSVPAVSSQGQKIYIDIMIGTPHTDVSSPAYFQNKWLSSNKSFSIDGKIMSVLHKISIMSREKNIPLTVLFEEVLTRAKIL
ncbi:MAG: hypothetical protein P857_872 [Candidatus Xenolissoclinum pacificiensis L6]|uniref:Uncharacterized protein n=1 Tax=Candidatus Xenolissoclinum pacificiensis L6 TaxID=1401685 RepID=W2V0U6_9RICK|nr:MAG: hypothetical protein P857_872 [Candidatus Xenolissoclinum pacificiensis L6]